MRHRVLLALPMALALVVCGQQSGAREKLLVSAASSLTAAFSEIETVFEEANPSVDVVLNLAGSSTLREQILAGAPADVFASADTGIMGEVAAAGRTAGEPVVFASNRLIIAVPSQNPGSVTGLEDLTRADLLIGLCAEGVPCGDFARRVLADAGVQPLVDTEEPNVRALLIKIQEGELDAGITYRTDVVAAGQVEGVEIPDEVNLVAEYPIAILADSSSPGAAEDFVELVTSETGRGILADHGFGAP